MFRTVIRAAALLVIVMPAASLAAQAPASAELVTACLQSQQQVLLAVDAANRRLELARQTNQAAAMRAAMDDLQGVLSAMRTALTPCATLQAAATPAADAHAGHAMPGAPPSAAPAAPATPRTPAVQPRPATQAPAGQPGIAPGLSVMVHTTPDPPRGAAENQFMVMVKDRQGKPVTGADVSLLFYMPAMPAMKMGEIRNEIALTSAGDGTYTGKGQILMAGSWTVTVSVKENGKVVGQQQVTLAAK